MSSCCTFLIHALPQPSCDYAASFDPSSYSSMERSSMCLVAKNYPIMLGGTKFSDVSISACHLAALDGLTINFNIIMILSQFPP